MPVDIIISYSFILLLFSGLFRRCGGGMHGPASLNFFLFHALPESETHGGREILGRVCQIAHVWQALGLDICLLTPWCWASHSSSLHIGKCHGAEAALCAGYPTGLPTWISTFSLVLIQQSLSMIFSLGIFLRRFI